MKCGETNLRNRRQCKECDRGWRNRIAKWKEKTLVNFETDG
jgi:hypothetical protein